jgi:two-component system nitrogen regulation sensor histidine kinase GlnL
VVDAQARISLINPAAELLLGHSERQVAGRRVAALDPGLDELQELIARALDSGQSFGQNLELQFATLDRQPLLTSCRVSPLPDAGSQAVVVEILDTSQLRQLDREKALTSQLRASRQMIRQLAHEVRNPLGGLRGAAQLLERELEDPDQLEFTQVIIREADRLVALTSSLLGPSREPAQEPVNIHQLLERVVLLLENDVSDSVGLYRDYDPSLPELIGDHDLLIQALLNLGRNAVQSVGLSGNIVFRTRALTSFTLGDTRHRLVMSVEIEDDGPGVPEELRDSLFFPLVTGREGGTGLGLPLAQDLVNRQGGLIEFESEPGRTVFSLRLPLES